MVCGCLGGGHSAYEFLFDQGEFEAERLADVGVAEEDAQVAVLGRGLSALPLGGLGETLGVLVRQTALLEGE